MKLTFLGGASAIGASSILVEVANSAFLVDCGVRFRSSSPLPDLGALAGKRLDAILVTHAHSDHTGGLPVVHEEYPQAPILTTPPTADLIRILQRDALKIMDSAAEREGDIPLFNERQVEAMTQALRPIHHGAPLTMGDVEIRFLPASHILGASMIHLATPSGNLLITGDYSVSAQATVPALDRLHLPVDLVVTETTYGDRLHSDRGAAENRLIDRVREVVEEGGRVLIPAFAIGRAQEILLILKRALRTGRMPEVPIHVDGMVRSVCEVYSRHERYGSALLSREIRAGRHPFYDDWIRPVKTPADRREVLAGGPCVIVASSGMLSGGASAFYALELAPREQDAILITGYQDEESPGRALLQLAEQGGQGTLRLGDKTVEVRCRFESYGLSAHADRNQMAGFLGMMRPKTVALVHGNQDAKRGLAQALAVREIEQANDGTVLQRRYSPRPIWIGGIATQEPLPLDRAELVALLGLVPLDERIIASRLAQQWYGRTPKATEVTLLVEALEKEGLARRNDQKRHILEISELARKLVLGDENLEEELKSENPKGRLLEWCARQRLEAPSKIETFQDGKTGVELRITWEGRLLTSGLQRSSSAKIAEQLAARELLRCVTERAAASVEELHRVDDADEGVLKRENPKGKLLELCSRSHWPTPTYETVPVPNGFRVRILAQLDSLPRSPWFLAARVRTAEQAAAAWVLQHVDSAAQPTAPAAPTAPDFGGDPRMILNELRQNGLLKDFGYEQIETQGPSHAPRFTIRAWAVAPGGAREAGPAAEAASKKEAQHLAAKTLVRHLRELRWL